MHLRQRISSLASIVCVALCLYSCANIGRPSGGEQDTAGPQVIGVLPYPGTLFFNYKEIVFHFDEFLKPGNYKNEIFISPVPMVDPEVIVKNKTLTIKFLAPLRDSTTYVISLGTGIADFNEGNKMESSYTYAFSTGAVLDSLQVSGRVTDLWSGTGEKDMKMMLFRANEFDGDSIQGKRPEYLVMSDKSGAFDFKFLAPGDYKIYGVSDANSDSKYSGISEKIALAPSPLIQLMGDSVVPKLEMTAFFQNDGGPKVKSAKWANDYTIHVEFNKRIRSNFDGENLAIFMSDTNGADLQLIDVARFKYKDLNHLYLDAPYPRDKNYDLRIVNLMDSLGEKGDTTVRLLQLAQVKDERGKWYDTPINERRGHDFIIPTLFHVTEGIDSSQIQLLDSASRPQAVEWISTGMVIFGKPTKMLTPGVEYKIKLQKSILLPNGKTVDTLVTLKINFPNPNDFGTIAGVVLPDSLRPDAQFNVMMRGILGTGLVTHALATEKGSKGKGGDAGASSTFVDRFQERFTAPGPFHYVFLYPGKYTIDIIDDVDGNGVLTPGRLHPYTMPEKVYHEATPLEIKAKWDVKDVEIYPVPGKGKAKGAKGGEPEPTPGGGKAGQK